jgi:hypothetical protein
LRGRAIRLSLPRRLVIDLVYFARGVPSIPVQRRMCIAPLLAARAACSERPPWSAIFAKAFALTARDVPELRRAYVKIPWPHLYEYPASTAAIICRRDYYGEPAVFPLLVKDPASLSVLSLGRIVRHAIAAPVEEIKEFRRALLVSRLPRPLRRFLWWLALNIGRQRPNFLGTYGVSVYSASGADSLHPLSPLTTLLNYGPIGPDGDVAVRMIYDHRTMDGATIGEALAKLETVLNVALTKELADLSAGSPDQNRPTLGVRLGDNKRALGRS